jgi:hypothetical protein
MLLAATRKTNMSLKNLIVGTLAAAADSNALFAPISTAQRLFEEVGG